jgi:hypothetical protein
MWAYVEAIDAARGMSYNFEPFGALLVSFRERWAHLK